MLCLTLVSASTWAAPGLSSTPGGVINSAPDTPAAMQPLDVAAEAPYGAQVVELVNQERAAAGAPPLKSNSLLGTSSLTHSTNMAVRDFFSHCDQDTDDSPGDRIADAGYNWSSYGENIAAGYASPNSVMNGWMNSAGHRANIESSSFREIGVGYFLDSSDKGNVRLDRNRDCDSDDTGGPYGYYWTQNFGRRYNVYPLVIDSEAYLTGDRDVDLYVYGLGFAQDMRFRNEDGPWSEWETYQENKEWRLNTGDCEKTVTAEIRNASSVVLSAADSIILELLCSALYDVLNLTAQTISTFEVMEACTMIIAGDDTVFSETADVTLRAPEVQLQPGLTIRAGARFRVQSIRPNL